MSCLNEATRMEVVVVGAVHTLRAWLRQTVNKEKSEFWR